MRVRSPQLVAFSLVLMFSASAAAFELPAPPRRWFPDDLSREVIVDNTGLDDVTDPDTDGGLMAAMGAVVAWNDAFDVVSAAPGSPINVALGDGLSHLVFDDPFKICKGRCLAVTLTVFDDSQTGTCDGLSVVRIIDSDIFFNTKGRFAVWTSEAEDPTDDDSCAGEVYVETVVTHEVGHLIGLAHSAVSGALMSATIGACDNATLQDDDEDGRDELYACTSFASCGDGSCQPVENQCTCSADCGAPPGVEAGVQCSDAVDNDCDLCIDSIDSDCGGIEVGMCTGGVDDDCWNFGFAK